jgi:predicted O-methyltransferase YrrM
MATFNENWYSDSQVKNMCDLFESVRDMSGQVVEIGCWEGKSTSFLANTVYPEILVCNDTWMGNTEESKLTGVTHISELIAKERDVLSVFKKNMNALTKGNYKIIQKDCIEWLQETKEPIKFAHIDASHEYESVAKTLELIFPLVVPGGILCGDDFLNSHIDRIDLHGGVQRAVFQFLPEVENKENLWFWKKPID